MPAGNSGKRISKASLFAILVLLITTIPFCLLYRSLEESLPDIDSGLGPHEFAISRLFSSQRHSLRVAPERLTVRAERGNWLKSHWEEDKVRLEGRAVGQGLGSFQKGRRGDATEALPKEFGGHGSLRGAQHEHRTGHSGGSHLQDLHEGQSRYKKAAVQVASLGTPEWPRSPKPLDTGGAARSRGSLERGEPQAWGSALQGLGGEAEDHSRAPLRQGQEGGALRSEGEDWRTGTGEPAVHRNVPEAMLQTEEHKTPWGSELEAEKRSNPGAEEESEWSQASHRHRAREGFCQGRYIFMYDLPPEFNTDPANFSRTMYKYIPTCPDVANNGLGRPVFNLRETQSSSSSSLGVELVPERAWFRTDQFALEPIFHARMLDYPCLTDDPDQATLFFIPAYAGLAICATLYQEDIAKRDKPAQGVVEWLEKHDSWHRHAGRDHVIVLGRVIWDFLRTINDERWGTALMSYSYMRNVMALSIEGSIYPVHGRVKSIPYPTAFHPASASDIHTWQAVLRASPRSHLVAFLGGDHGMGGKLREALYSQCKRLPAECSRMACKGSKCRRPGTVLSFYRKAHFCFQPPGDTPTRKGFFDCILGGAVPVIFNEFTSHKQFRWHLPPDFESYSVYFPEQHFWQTNGTTVFQVLRSIPANKVRAMREAVIGLIPKLVYNMPGASNQFHGDAFDISIHAALEDVTALNLSEQVGKQIQELKP